MARWPTHQSPEQHEDAEALAKRRGGELAAAACGGSVRAGFAAAAQVSGAAGFKVTPPATAGWWSCRRARRGRLLAAERGVPRADDRPHDDAPAAAGPPTGGASTWRS